jgi:signal transduction histidine kinase
MELDWTPDLKPLSKEDGWVTLSVQDNGVGITKAEISSPPTLGLAGMKERAALLGGEIVLHGHPERGTIVNVRIPKSGTPVQPKELI